MDIPPCASKPREHRARAWGACVEVPPPPHYNCNGQVPKAVCHLLEHISLMKEITLEVVCTFLGYEGDTVNTLPCSWGAQAHVAPVASVSQVDAAVALPRRAYALVKDTLRIPLKPLMSTGTCGTCSEGQAGQRSGHPPCESICLDEGDYEDPTPILDVHRHTSHLSQASIRSRRRSRRCCASTRSRTPRTTSWHTASTRPETTP